MANCQLSAIPGKCGPSRTSEAVTTIPEGRVGQGNIPFVQVFLIKPYLTTKKSQSEMSVRSYVTYCLYWVKSL